MLTPKKKPEEKAIKVTIAVPPEILKKIDRIATKARISRSQLIANLVDAGLEDALLCEKIGLVALVGTYRDIQELVKASCGVISLEA